MLDTKIVKDKNFKEVSEVKPDYKNRVTIGKKWSATIKVTTYKVYTNSIGQIILDPQASIPAHELWLFKNKDATKLVQSGLDAIKEGRVVKSKEDFSKYIDD